MKTFTFILVFCSIGFFSFGQVIKGAIFDKQTSDTISFATIYFNGTYVGTSSNKNGYFELDVSKNKSMPLTVSAVGYYSVTLINFTETDYLKIYLEPKIYDIGEVVINASSLERKRRRYLRIFKEEFLGTTKSAEKCIIKNEEDITFNYNSDTDTLKAYAQKPIYISNEALGYQITYFLDKFEYCKRNGALQFKGNIIFKDDSENSSLINQHFKSERKIAYMGSRMHFIRELGEDSLETSDFIVRNQFYEPMILNDIVYIDDNLEKFLINTGSLIIEYRNQKSNLDFLEDYIYFDESGFFNPDGIIWSGDMGSQRIADWLPYEYKLAE